MLGVCEFRPDFFYEHSEKDRAPHTHESRDVPRCGAMSLLQKPLQSRLAPSKISGVGTNFGLLENNLSGPNKQRAFEPSILLSWIKGQTGRFVYSMYSYFQIHISVIRGPHLARSIIKNTCWDGLDRILRKCVDLWTSRVHQGRSIAVNKISWVIDGPKLWLFKNVSPNMIPIIRYYSIWNFRKTSFGKGSC